MTGLPSRPLVSARPVELFALALPGVSLLWSARGGPAPRIGTRTLPPVSTVPGTIPAHRVIHFFLPLPAAAVVLTVRERQHRRTRVASR
jgi:hypothetical protein